MAVTAIPVAIAAGANASPLLPQPAASHLHLDWRIDGLRAGVHIDHCGVSGWFSDKHLGIKKSVSIGC
ncbi:hypothetical protein JOF56_003805 [Kibdelosporangium banguiense]|uniref:Uncharacterized protein n=1 Tax=Kibdelosporangium banguiense TaxID=1365924 RepID=A0ABS4THC2_9PSEU|nr:hypothetical protein [Kibdelosporangium banguiense]MBP2323420.1 hypothetical protein [Kibdelosporangium banguiense]